MELWGKDAMFNGAVSPVFYNRAGESLTPPTAFQDAVARITGAVCCVSCRHSHLLGPMRVVVVASPAGDGSNEPDVHGETFSAVQAGIA